MQSQIIGVIQVHTCHLMQLTMLFILLSSHLIKIQMQVKQILKSRLVSLVILIIVGLIIYLTGRMSGDRYKENILNNPSITTAIVTNVELKGRPGNFVQYNFKFNGKIIYSNGNAHKEFAPLKRFIVNRQFPVIFSSIDPNYNMILILPEDFKEYNMPFPDSLNWVLQYLK